MKRNKHLIIIFVIMILIILFFIFVPKQCNHEPAPVRDKKKPETEIPTETPNTTQEKADKTPLPSTIAPTPRPTPENSVSKIPEVTPLQQESEPEAQSTPTFPPASPGSQLQSPYPDCIYIGSDETGWYCYNGKMRLLAFHDWRCMGRKRTQVEILEETTTTCIGDDGIDMFDVVTIK